MKNPRAPVWKRLLRLAAFAIIVLVTIATLTLSWISFQGRREWAQTKADLIARGEKLSLVELTPPPIPDALNFFGDPIWKELADTVVETGENGAKFQEPRLPSGHRQIDAIDPELPPNLLEAEKTLFPQNLSSGPQPGSRAATSAYLLLHKTTEITTQRALAQFMLDALEPGQPTRDRIENLLTRPSSNAASLFGEGPPATFVYLNYLLNLARIYNLQAQAHLILDRPDLAAKEISTEFRLADALKSGALLITHLARVAIFDIGASGIDSGIAGHRWTEAELQDFDSRLAHTDILRDLASVLRSERGYSNDIFQVLFQNHSSQTTEAQALLQALGGSRNATAFMAYYRIIGSSDQAFNNRFLQQYIDILSSGSGISPKRHPVMATKDPVFRTLHPLSVAIVAESLESSILRTISVEDHLRETRIACALERYYLQNHVYPDALGALVPAYLSSIPMDAIAGQVFHYRRESPDRFLLWSVGWNEIDENGSRGLTPRDLKTGDWVWSQQ